MPYKRGVPWAKMALVDFLAKSSPFKRYSRFTSSIGTAIYEVLFVFYSYSNDDMETSTFDHAVLLAMLHNLSMVE